jgi:superfamily II DNA or RNA helicase
MAVELRPYQEQARAAVWAQWDGGARRTLLVMPTGCGKTVVFAKVIADVSRKGGRSLVLAHRGELLQQAADKLSAATGLGAAVEKAQESCIGSFFSAVVGSVQTLCRPERLEQFGHGYFDAIIVDEAHHVLAESYQRVLAHFPAAKVLGVTATADRGDKRDLGQYFESMAYEYSLHEAIRDGYLCPIKAQTVPLELDISGVGVSAGDFKAAELGNALGPYLHRIADEMAAAGCLGRKTVAFLPLVATSQYFARILASKGFDAMEANGESTDRAEVLQAFAKAGPGAVLCNSMLLTEGWDQPDVDCIVVLRPTKVRSLYAQMVGRGTRTSPGKGHLLILDFLWHTDRHELVRPAALVCQSAEVAARMTADVQAAGGQWTYPRPSRPPPRQWSRSMSASGRCAASWRRCAAGRGRWSTRCSTPTPYRQRTWPATPRRSDGRWRRPARRSWQRWRGRA